MLKAAATRAEPRRLLLGALDVLHGHHPGRRTVRWRHHRGEKRQLFDEHVEWYRMYGMSMRPVPETWEDFQVYWDHMCRNVLEDN